MTSGDCFLRVLFVEDNLPLARGLKTVLEEAGFVVDHCSCGEDAADFSDLPFMNAALIDLGLPGMDGLALIQNWRHRQIKIPVMVMTARDRFTDMVAGFRAGADDFLRKPVQNEELVIRLWALIRRSGNTIDPVLQCGDIALDTITGAVSRFGLPLKLTSFEGRILRYLLHRKGAVVSRTELSEHIYDSFSERDFNSIEVMVSRLRRKIIPVMIETVRGEGYLLRTPSRD
jgi:two-component system, OmpR family, response regulator